MEIPNLKSWKTGFLLSIILPVSLLTAFRLSGLMNGPSAIAETRILEPVKWEFEKSFACTDWPLWFDSPDETCVKNSYANGSVSVAFAVVPAQYSVGLFPYDSSALGVSLNMTASIPDGFVDKVRISFREDYNMSQVSLVGWDWQKPPWNFENLSLTDSAYCFDNKYKLVGDEKAFIEASGKNRPREFKIDGFIYWILRAPENMSQQLEATAIVTYFNGTCYAKIVLPILLTLMADAGNTLETARTITPGTYVANIANRGENLDPMDYYKIRLNRGQAISIKTVLRYPLDASLRLYDWNGNLRASVNSSIKYDPSEGTILKTPEAMDEIKCAVDTDGYWYIEIWIQGDISYKLIVAGS